MSYQLINIQKNRKNLVVGSLQTDIENKLLCLATKKLVSIKLGNNVTSDDDYYNYLELEMLSSILDKISCESSCYNVCVDDVIKLIRELLYKLC